MCVGEKGFKKRHKSLADLQVHEANKYLHMGENLVVICCCMLWDVFVGFKITLGRWLQL